MARAAIAGALLLAGAAGPAPAGDPAYGAWLASECVTCHQSGGPPVGGIPAITGWPVESFKAVMEDYRARRRHNPVMETIAGRLGDAEIAALAAYFGGLPSGH